MDVEVYRFSVFCEKCRAGCVGCSSWSCCRYSSTDHKLICWCPSSSCTCHLMSRSSKVTCRSVSYSLYPPLGSCTNSNSCLSKRSSKASVLYICSAAIKFYNNSNNILMRVILYSYVNHMQQLMLLYLYYKTIFIHIIMYMHARKGSYDVYMHTTYILQTH